MEETALKPEFYTPNPHTDFREGGGEEMAFKRVDGETGEQGGEQRVLQEQKHSCGRGSQGALGFSPK